MGERCQKCEGEWVECWNGCEEGWVDEYDDDPINYAPGQEFRQCNQCHGNGGWTVCTCDASTEEVLGEPPAPGGGA